MVPAKTMLGLAGRSQTNGVFMKLNRIAPLAIIALALASSSVFAMSFSQLRIECGAYNCETAAAQGAILPMSEQVADTLKSLTNPKAVTYADIKTYTCEVKANWARVGNSASVTQIFDIKNCAVSE